MNIESSPAIHIFFTADNNYAKYLAVSIVSIVVNTESPVHFYILDGGISEHNKNRIACLQKIKSFEIEYIPIDCSRFNHVPKSSQKHISDNTNYRFLISSLKPDLDKCIFLDADLVAQGDIAQLWHVDVTNDYMAAVTDQFPLKPNSWAKKLPLPENYIYVNTGVSVMNLKKWREDRIEEKLFDNLEKYRNLLWFPDQDTLNITLAPHVQYLPHIFNAMPVQRYYDMDQKKEAFSNPVILHWAGPKKPWKKPWVEMSHVYFHFARMTPFYEEILYVNLAEREEKTRVVEKNSTVSQRILKDALQYGKLRRRYYRYRFLSKIMLGKKRKHYEERKKSFRERLRAVRRFINSD